MSLILSFHFRWYCRNFQANNTGCKCRGWGKIYGTEEGEDKKPPVQQAPVQPASVQQADSVLPIGQKKPPTVTVNGVPAIFIIVLYNILFPIN